jgi:hypothetical protein
MAAMIGDSWRAVDRRLAHARRKLRAAAHASEARRLDSLAWQEAPTATAR